MSDSHLKQLLLQHATAQYGLTTMIKARSLRVDGVLNVAKERILLRESHTLEFQ